MEGQRQLAEGGIQLPNLMSYANGEFSEKVSSGEIQYADNYQVVFNYMGGEESGTAPNGYGYRNVMPEYFYTPTTAWWDGSEGFLSQFTTFLEGNVSAEDYMSAMQTACQEQLVLLGKNMTGHRRLMIHIPESWHYGVAKEIRLRRLAANENGWQPVLKKECNSMATKQKHKLSRAARQEERAGLLFILAPIVGFLCFMLFPICFSIVLSFQSWTGIGDMRFVGFDNFAELFTTPTFWYSLGNTFFYLIGIPIGMIIALFLAMGMNRKIPACESCVPCTTFPWYPPWLRFLCCGTRFIPRAVCSMPC